MLQYSLDLLPPTLLPAPALLFPVVPIAYVSPSSLLLLLVPAHALGTAHINIRTLVYMRGLASEWLNRRSGGCARQCDGSTNLNLIRIVFGRPLEGRRAFT